MRSEDLNLFGFQMFNDADIMQVQIQLSFVEFSSFSAVKIQIWSEMKGIRQCQQSQEKK